MTTADTNWIQPGATVAISRPACGDLPFDPGCGSCGTCIDHDGCADSDNPLAEGDCPECGACAACIALCAAEHPYVRG